jgi:integrase
VCPSDWNPRAQRVNGKTANAVKLNGLLDNFRSRIFNNYREISDKEVTVTAEKVKNAFLGFKTNQLTLLQLFDKHIEDLKTKIGKELTRVSFLRYVCVRNRLDLFLQDKYNISDIDLREINYSFVCNFEIFLKSNYPCGHNAALKLLRHLRTIILIARNNGLINIDPFANYKFSLEKYDREYLTQQELETIMNKSFSIKRLEQVRDIFIFSCFSGLAYIDVENLCDKNIRNSFDGNLWIIGKRHKTDVSFTIPLLNVPKMILEKYKGNLPNGELLPVISNQKMNAYLKEITEICGIDKHLTFHCARHTFATTVTLAKGVSIESVSKMLGHSNIKTTQIYARINETKVGNEMAILKEKIKDIETKYSANY